MEGAHGIDIWNVGFPWMHDHWRWNGYHIEIGRYILGEFKEGWLYEIRKQLKTDTTWRKRFEFKVFL